LKCDWRESGGNPSD